MTNKDKTTDTFQLLWQQIETWLSRYAPHAWKLLRPGASEMEIQQAEATMDLTLPEDFKASCRLHDGGYVIDLVTEMNILPLKDIVDEWQMFQELEEAGTWSNANVPYYFMEKIRQSGWQTGPIQPVWWHQCWIPIGRDRAGNDCCLDLVPAPGGSVGQVIDRDHETGPSRVLTSRFLDVLSAFAQDLEAGKYEDTIYGLSICSDD
jgi:cell wall assembly regulator SMI1